MGQVVKNAVSFNKGLDGAIARFERKWIMRNKKLVTQAMRRLISKTPVHTGQTVRSYVATNGAPYSGPAKSPSLPVEPTNKLALGAEQLRAPAEGVALSTLAQVDFSNPYDVFFITNRSPAVAGLEIGALPKAPFVPRSPQGMFAVTLQELSALLDSGALR